LKDCRATTFALRSIQPLSLTSGERALLPPAVSLLHRQDPHERFHGVDLAVVDLEHPPHRQLIAAALAPATELRCIATRRQVNDRSAVSAGKLAV
jgi:hypothetical protein